MAALALSVGAAKGWASLSTSQLLVQSGRPAKAAHRLRSVAPRQLVRLRTATWRWERVMGRRLSYRRVRPADVRTLRVWQRIARRTYLAYLHPPHRSAWLCIHRYEGSWWDSGDPYWGGLQMDRGFMEFYAPRLLLRRGLANRWTALEQMWVAERAHRSGRGYWPWPNTARACGLL